MATAYTIVVPNPVGVPATVEVHVTAMRRDGRALSREELEALAVVYPPPTAEGRAAARAAIESAPSGAAGKRAKTSVAPRKPVTKRAAAKRPATR